MTSRAAGALGELRLAAGWHRRLLAGSLAAAAAAAVIQVATPAAPDLRPVLVAARDLAGGATLGSGDLVRRFLPVDAVPSGALTSTDDATGRVLAAPVRSGETVTDVRLVGPSLLAAAGPGLVAAPVRLADAGAVSLLRPGDRVDVLAADDHAAGSSSVAGEARAAGAASGSDDPARSTGPAATQADQQPVARVVAADVLVLALPDGQSGIAAPGGLVVLATTPEVAARLAAAATGASISVSVRGQR